jgi:hypothetical protein
MFLKQFVRRHTLSTALTLYLILYTIMMVYKPAFLYNPDGSLRPFGVGYRSQTVLPVWLVSIALAILAYFFVLNYAHSKTFKD